MFQQQEPGDCVITTGESHSVRELMDKVFQYIGLDWRRHVEVDARHLRPTEVDCLLWDTSKARAKLGWKPKVRFEQLAKMMLDHDIELAKPERLLRDAGHKVMMRDAGRL
jgi:GDPmannose 4,6-dehydratase